MVCWERSVCSAVGVELKEAAGNGRASRVSGQMGGNAASLLVSNQLGTESVSLVLKHWKFLALPISFFPWAPKARAMPCALSGHCCAEDSPAYLPFRRLKALV